MSHASPAVHAVCVPHLPFLELQDRAQNAPFWAAYDAQAAALRAFDPELVIAFGSDHYEGQLMRSMAPFMIGVQAEAVPDTGGFPGPLQVPQAQARACAQFLMEQEFDVAVSHAMLVDHGFSHVLHRMLGGVAARPVIPVFINSLAQPRPSFARVRKFGQAVGRFAAQTGLRVAVLGSGGLSHETGDIFPQVHETQDPVLREFLIHGGERGPLSRAEWRENLKHGLAEVNRLMQARTPGVGQVRADWDARFLQLLARGDLVVFDDWRDADVEREAGNGAGEVRSWVAAMAAAQAMGAGAPVVDHYESGTLLTVAAVVAHASSPARVRA